MFTTCPKIRNTICRKVFFFGTKSVSLKCQFIHVYVIIRKIRKRVTWSDDDTNLLASNVLIVPEPEASDHCGACSPSHSRWSMWTPPAEGTPACRSARSWIQTPIGNVLLHLEYRWDKRKWHTVFHHTFFFFFLQKYSIIWSNIKMLKKNQRLTSTTPDQLDSCFTLGEDMYGPEHTFTVQQILVSQNSHGWNLVEKSFRLNSPPYREWSRENDSEWRMWRSKH